MSRPDSLATRAVATADAFGRDVSHNRGYLYTTNARLSSRLANRRLTDAALEAVALRGRTLLDVGCGDGTYTNDLYDLGGPSSVYAFDPVAEAIAVARERQGERHITFAEHAADRIPVPDDRFDVAHLRGVLHHMERPIEALREAFRVARVLVVIEPNGYNPVLKVIEKTSRYHREHGERSFAPSTLRRWIAGLGGRTRSLTYAGLVPFFCPDVLAVGLKRVEPLFERVTPLNQLSCAVSVLVAER